MRPASSWRQTIRCLLLSVAVSVLYACAATPIEAQIDSPHYQKALEAIVVDVNDMPAAVSELEIALDRAEDPREKAGIGLLWGLVTVGTAKPNEAIEMLKAVIACKPDLQISLPEQEIART